MGCLFRSETVNRVRLDERRQVSLSEDCISGFYARGLPLTAVQVAAALERGDPLAGDVHGEALRGQEEVEPVGRHLEHRVGRA